MTPTYSGGYFFQDFQVNNSGGAQLINSQIGVTPYARSLNGVFSFNWQNQPTSTPTVTVPTGQSAQVLEFDGSPWHAGIDWNQYQYTFVNGRTYTFSFWARTTSGSRSITAMMTDNINDGVTSAAYTITTDWRLVTVTKTYSNVGTPRLFYDWDTGGAVFQVYGAQITDITDAAYGSVLPAFLAQTQEQFGYDLDGNLTGDGRWNYNYDAENRLITIETNTAAVNAGVLRQRLTFVYDYADRRVSKKVESGWNGSTYTSVDLWHRFIYNGSTLVAETDHNSVEAIVKNIFWGLDLSGTGQGAGGTGGLLLIQDGGNSYLPAYDAMGSVHGLIKASDGSMAARYEYDAFGKTLRESGAYAANNSIRYSTQYTDLETGLVYYGHRFYNPSLGRFINRDPIEEAGGLNLYAFCGNNGVNSWDCLGLDQTVDGIIWSPPPSSFLGLGPTRPDPIPNQGIYTTGWGVGDRWLAGGGQDRSTAYMGVYDIGTDKNGDTIYSWVNPNSTVPTDLLSRYFGYGPPLGSLGTDSSGSSGENGCHILSSTGNADGSITYQTTTGNYTVAPGGSAIPQGSAIVWHGSVSPQYLSGRSGLGKTLRHIPLVGGMLGAVGDIISGVGNAALGIVTIGGSATLGRGLGQIGYGLAQGKDIIDRDIVASIAGIEGKIYVTARDVANLVTFGQIDALGNRVTGQTRATGPSGAITRTLLNGIVPCYGNFNGSGWGVPNYGLRPDLRINQSDVAAFTHDQVPSYDWQWLHDQYSTHPEMQWVGPVGAAYALLGTLPFTVRGAFQSK